MEQTYSQQNTETLALISDPVFEDLLREANDHALLFKDFEQLPMPAGFDSQTVWEALHHIRRTQAIYYSDLHYYNGIYKHQWYSSTRKINRLLQDISDRTHTGSPLDVALNERSGRHFVVQPLIEEAVASIQSDCYEIDYETARAVIVEERPAQTVPEKLACNMHAILYTLESYDRYEFSLELIDRIYADLTREINTENLERPEYKGYIWPEWAHPDRETALEVISAVASGALVDEAEHPIITSMILSCKFWKFTPLPHFNYSMGSIISRLYLRRKGYPVFCYIPSSSAPLAWRNGTVPSERVLCSYQEAGIDFGSDRDWTPYYETVLDLISIELDRLEQTILSMKDKDNELLKKIQHNQSINHRQQTVLSKALLVPETEFTIAAHQLDYSTAYSTARADLLSLVKRGFLTMHQEDRAMVFSARPDIKTVVGTRL